MRSPTSLSIMDPLPHPLSVPSQKVRDLAFIINVKMSEVIMSEIIMLEVKMSEVIMSGVKMSEVMCQR